MPLNFQIAGGGSAKFRRRLILAISAVVYSAALAVAWLLCTQRAERRLVEKLEFARHDYAATVEDEIGCMLMHSALLVREEINEPLKPRSIEEVSKIARSHGLDELNFVNRDGVVVASNLPGVLGFDFKSDQLVHDFLSLTNAAECSVTHPLRTAREDRCSFYKYLGLPLKDGGFLEAGISMRQFIVGREYYDEVTLDSWMLSARGWLNSYEYACEHFPDVDLSGLDDGQVSYLWSKGERWAFLSFTYAGRRIVAVFPESEFLGERNFDFALLVPALTVFVVLIAIFALFVLRNAEAQQKQRRIQDENARRDLAVAKLIQESSLPRVVNELGVTRGCDFDAFSRPAKEVGGDFYDFYPVSENRFVFTIADVSGKGVPAAMFMMRAKNELKNAILSGAPLAAAVGAANAALCAANEAEMFVTAFVGILDFDSGEFEYVNAGHNRPFLRGTDGAIRQLRERGGRFLGLFPDADYHASCLRFAAGEMLFLYTDGVTEAFNAQRQVFGDERLKRTLQSAGGGDARSTLAAVTARVAAFAGKIEPSDDLTTLAVRWLGAAGARQKCRGRARDEGESA